MADSFTAAAGRQTLANRYSNLAMVLQDLGDFRGARERLEQAIVIGERHYAPDHPNLATCYSNLASALVHTGEPERACALWARAQEILEEHFPTTHPNVQTVLAWRAKYCAEQTPNS